MTRILVPLFLTLISACSSEEISEQSRLMERIERQVQLPAGSKGLRNYARYYAPDGDRVVGIYISSYSPDGNLDLPLGQRRWINDPEGLPMILDGGCDVIEVTFMLERNAIERAQCNGDA